MREGTFSHVAAHIWDVCNRNLHKILFFSHEQQKKKKKKKKKKTLHL